MSNTGGLPKTVKVEIEWVPGTWTDVSADVEADVGFTLTSGRTSPLSQPQPGTATVTFTNRTGKFTPGVQVLTDGTAAPYYPNVRPRRRIRFSYVSSSTTYYRFTGRITSYTPVVSGSKMISMTVTAVDRLADIAGVTMPGAIRSEIDTDTPAYYWPLTDEVGSTQAQEASGQAALQVVKVLTGDAETIAFGESGAGAGDGTGMRNTPTTNTSGQWLWTTKIKMPVTGYSIEAWINVGTGTSIAQDVFGVLNATSDTYIYFATLVGNQVGVGAMNQTGATSAVIGNKAIYDGNYHHIVITQAASGTISLYVDGALVAGSTASAMVTTWQQVKAAAFTSLYTGLIGHLALYNTVLSTTRITAHYVAGHGFGERLDDRVKRFLALAGLGSSDMNVNASSVFCRPYAQTGVDVLTGCQDMAVTEGGGSAVYADGAGVVNFNNRLTRSYFARTPVLTLDAEADLHGDVFQPSHDDLSLINSVTVGAGTSDGASSSSADAPQVATDQASITEFGLSSTDLLSYDQSSDGRLRLAQSIVAGNSQPATRLPQVAVDLVTATNDLWSACAAATMSTRLRISNLPRGGVPFTQVDLYVEGITETCTTASYVVTFDASPVGPQLGLYTNTGAAPSAGRYQAAGQTLTSTITAAATAVSITTVAGNPTLTQVSNCYPMDIQIGAEVMTLAAAPASSTSPQTFTVTRGQQGTAAAAQTAGATVTLWPITAYSL